MYTRPRDRLGGFEVVKLPHRVVQAVFDQAVERSCLRLGASGVRLATDLRHALTALGKQWAIEAFSKTSMSDPHRSHWRPVPRIMRQAISNARIDRAAVDRAFSGLAISPNFVLQIGPAINSGKSILLYGPARTARRRSPTHRHGLSRCDLHSLRLRVEGQIVKVFDAGVHLAAAARSGLKSAALRREDFDSRWVPCRRPFIVVGGELTLEMLI
jgi:hypothetical protein